MKIAYLEDDLECLETVSEWLREAGYEVSGFTSGVECARVAVSEGYDACLLDWIVDDLSGIDVMARLRVKLRQAMPPVVFVTGRDSEQDIVEALNAGADDYVTKPLSKPVLLARLQAVLRRRGQGDAEPQIQTFGRITIDHDRRKFLLDGQVVVMTDRETDLALYFFRNIGRLLTREHLIRVVWALSPEIDTRTIDVHTSVLRRKMELTPEFGWRLVSVYGHGYRLEKLD